MYMHNPVLGLVPVPVAVQLECTQNKKDISICISKLKPKRKVYAKYKKRRKKTLITTTTATANEVKQNLRPSQQSSVV